MNFEQALAALKEGDFVTRSGWNGKGMLVGMHVPSADECMTQPYLFINTGHGVNTPWLPSQVDLLAYDWSIA